MHTTEYRWLYDYLRKLRDDAVLEMTDGVNQDRYAELRGYIQACDHFLAAPERYSKEMKAREAS